MRKRRRSSLLQFDSSTDLLSCGVGAAVLLFVIFMTTIGGKRNEERKLSMVSLVIDSRSVSSSPNRWGGGESCIELELRGTSVAQTCGAYKQLVVGNSPAWAVGWNGVDTLVDGVQILSSTTDHEVRIVILAELTQSEPVSVLISHYNNRSELEVRNDAGYSRARRRIPGRIELSVEELSEDGRGLRRTGVAETPNVSPGLDLMKDLGMAHEACQSLDWRYGTDEASLCLSGSSSGKGKQQADWIQAATVTDDYRLSFDPSGGQALRAENLATQRSFLWPPVGP